MSKLYFEIITNELGVGEIKLHNDNLTALFEMPVYMSLNEPVQPGLWKAKGNPLYNQAGKRFAYIWTDRAVPDAVICDSACNYPNWARIMLTKNVNKFFELLDTAMKKHGEVDIYINTQIPEEVLDGMVD